MTLCTPHELASPTPSWENNIVQGVTRFSTWAKRGGIWPDARVCLHYWVVIWVAGYCNPPYIAQFLGYVMGRIHMALRSYSVLDILLPPTIMIMQECSQALKTCKRLWSLSCGGVSNMLLVLPITFAIEIYGAVCVQLTHFSSGDWRIYL